MILPPRVVKNEDPALWRDVQIQDLTHAPVRGVSC